MTEPIEVKIEIGENLRDVMNNFLDTLKPRSSEIEGSVADAFRRAFGINVTEVIKEATKNKEN